MLSRRPGRKLLVASLGVAAVNYAYSCSSGPTTTTDAGLDAPMEAIVANLAPPPQDSGLDSNANDASDASTDVAADAIDDAGNG
jgi:hypothetical protein